MRRRRLLLMDTNEHTHEGGACSHCHSKNVYGMSRVVGYFTRINNWNPGKQAEFKDRQKGDYRV